MSPAGSALRGPGLRAEEPWDMAVQTKPLGGHEGPRPLGDQSPPRRTTAHGGTTAHRTTATGERWHHAARYRQYGNPGALSASSLGRGQQLQVQGQCYGPCGAGQEGPCRVRSGIQMPEQAVGTQASCPGRALVQVGRALCEGSASAAAPSPIPAQPQWPRRRPRGTSLPVEVKLDAPRRRWTVA